MEEVYYMNQNYINKIIKLIIITMTVYILGCQSEPRAAGNSVKIVPAPTSICPSGGVLINDNPVCNGSVGYPGISLVSVSRAATALECPNSGGTAVDIYRDIDFNGIVSDEDVLQSGVVACNGHNFLTPINVFHMANTTTCYQIATSLSINKSSATSNSVRVFNSTNCSGSVLATLLSDGNEVFITDNVLIILDGTNAGSGLTALTVRVLHLQ